MPAVFDFIPSKPSPIRPPPCIKCSAVMVLVRLEPDARGVELQIFECLQCQHLESWVVKSVK
jgi:hypothetical protein